MNARPRPSTTAIGLLCKMYLQPDATRESFQRGARALAELGLEIRAGVHSGECDLVAGDVRGLAVHVGARVAELAAPGEVLMTGTVADLLIGAGHALLDRGERVLRGVPGRWRMLALRELGAAFAPDESASGAA
jgi:class 3 adenylate cyclase